MPVFSVMRCGERLSRQLLLFKHSKINWRLIGSHSSNNIFHNKNVNQLSVSNAIGVKMSTFNEKGGRVELKYQAENVNRVKNEKQTQGILAEFVRSTKSLSHVEWVKAKENLITDTVNVKESNFESMVMFTCWTERNVSLAHSLFSYLTQTSKDPNIVTLSKYIRILGEADDMTDEVLILRLYDRVTARYKLVDSATAEDLIVGLCRTSKWKDSYVYLDMMKVTLRVPTYRAVCTVVVKAFEKGDYEVGWDLLANHVRHGQPELNYKEPIVAWIEQCKKAVFPQRKEMLIRLFNFLREFETVVHHNIVENVKYLLEISTTEEWSANVVKVTKRGICQACNTQLEPLTLTADEYEMLKDRFLERVIKGENVYLKTSPAELERFLNFLRYTAPYSVVLDGLNVAYTMTKKKNSPLEFAKQLLRVVRHYKSGDRKVLVLGREHMKAWPKEVFDEVKRESIMFFTDNLSKDDPFLLYAALYSGQGTKFISKDMMRDHKFALDDKLLASYFRKWQKAHQIELLTILPNGTVYSKDPRLFNPIVQENENYWHIPFCNSEPTTISWMCVKYIKSLHTPLPKLKLNVKRLMAKK
ncbi:hypothetical protein CHUAL_003333 [Chamberlinius hualienensis]